MVILWVYYSFHIYWLSFYCDEKLLILWIYPIIYFYINGL